MRRVPVDRFAEGRIGRSTDAVAREEPLEIRVGGISLAVVMRTPGHDIELVRGFLLTERIVARPGDIAAIRHCSEVADPEADENVVQVTLSDDVEIDLASLRRNLFASSSCGVCGKATVENALATAPPITTPAAFSSQLLYDLPDRLRAAQPVFEATGGLHAAGLFGSSGDLLVVHEDVGRHNRGRQGDRNRSPARGVEPLPVWTGRVRSNVLRGRPEGPRGAHPVGGRGLGALFPRRRTGDRERVSLWWAFFADAGMNVYGSHERIASTA